MTYTDCTCHYKPTKSDESKSYELKLCKEHGTMTNHIGDKCMKCDPTADIKPVDTFWYYLMYAPESNEDRIKYWEAIEDDVEKMFTQEISQAEQRERERIATWLDKNLERYHSAEDCPHKGNCLTKEDLLSALKTTDRQEGRKVSECCNAEIDTVGYEGKSWSECRSCHKQSDIQTLTLRVG